MHDPLNRPQPEPGQIWISDDGSGKIEIQRVDDLDAYYIWLNGRLSGRRPKDLVGFSFHSMPGEIVISAPLPERWDWRPYALSAPRRVWHRRTDWRME